MERDLVSRELAMLNFSLFFITGAKLIRRLSLRPTLEELEERNILRSEWTSVTVHLIALVLYTI